MYVVLPLMPIDITARKKLSFEDRCLEAWAAKNLEFVLGRAPNRLDAMSTKRVG